MLYMDDKEYKEYETNELIYEDISFKKFKIFVEDDKLCMLKLRNCKLHQSDDNTVFESGYNLHLKISKRDYELLKDLEKKIINNEIIGKVWNTYDIDECIMKKMYTSPLYILMGGTEDEMYILKCKMNYNETFLFNNDHTKINWGEDKMTDEIREKLYNSEQFDALIHLNMFWLFKGSMGMALKIKQILL